MDISQVPNLSFDIGLAGSSPLDETAAIQVVAGVVIGVALAVISSQ